MPEETRQTDAPEPRELRQRQRTKSPVSDSIEEKLNESDDSDDAQQDNDDLSESDENEPSFDKDKISIILKPNVNESSGSKPKVSTKSNSLIVTVIVVLSIIFAPILLNFFKNPSSSIYETINWRLKINSYANLSDNQRSTISASLKPILDKSINPQSTLSTLLILSSDENKAAQLARCLLHIVNAVQSRNQISTELNFENYGNNKLQLDTDLETLLRPDDTIRAVVLRRVDILSSLNAFEQLRLLFAYCDGENPKISDRLIIMTAASVPPMESQIRDEFKNRWPREHDFIDALMSRISGHTLQIDQHQTLFCN